MTSLFDVAADLSQYNDDKPSKAKVPAIHPQSALGILDETFETIYGARQYQSERKYPPLARSTSMVQLQPTRLAESKSAEALDARLNRLASFRATSTPAPRRMNPAIAVAGLIIPPPPSVPPPADNSRKASNIDKDPDIAAKAVLRDLTNEIDQLVATSTSSVEEDEALTRMLSDKYIHARLVRVKFEATRSTFSLLTHITVYVVMVQSKLSGTPFVQLVRKKVAQKLDQLEQRLRSRRSTRDPVAVEDDERSSNNDNNSGATPTMPLDGVATWKSLQRLTRINIKRYRACSSCQRSSYCDCRRPNWSSCSSPSDTKNSSRPHPISCGIFLLNISSSCGVCSSNKSNSLEPMNVVSISI